MIYVMPTWVRYWLLQLPGLALVAFLAWWAFFNGWIPAPLAVAIIAIWLLKDIALYPLTRHALQKSQPATGPAALVGQEAEVVQTLAPSGQVRVGGERWLARSASGEHILAGRRIRVVDVDGLTLVVQQIAKGRR
jgi:membrane protein implicated in regulation of membrane protease activity